MANSGLACPSCGHDISHVTSSRPAANGGRLRRRLCWKCEGRFSTIEILVDERDALEQAGDVSAVLMTLRSTAAVISGAIKKLEGA